MKSTFLALLLTLSINLFSQQITPAPTLLKQDYLKKNKHQKTTAWILLGGGTVAWLAGASKYMNQNDDIDGGGEVVMVVGGLAGLSSIPFFIMASKNKKKAMSFSFKNGTMPQLQKNNFAYRPIPSLTMKITL